jgi:hypothetical protein
MRASGAPRLTVMSWHRALGCKIGDLIGGGVSDAFEMTAAAGDLLPAYSGSATKR